MTEPQADTAKYPPIGAPFITGCRLASQIPNWMICVRGLCTHCAVYWDEDAEPARCLNGDHQHRVLETHLHLSAEAADQASREVMRARRLSCGHA